IRCFQCSSYTDPDCADVRPNDTNSRFLQKCEPRYDQKMFCRKTIQTVIDADFTRITRSCAWYIHKTNSSNCLVSDTDFKLETSCQCFTDACNVGTPLIVLPPALISWITLSSYFYRLLPW
ncbi:hypothetical protein BDFB_000091, partial [Asbolus verrucosus]